MPLPPSKGEKGKERTHICITGVPVSTPESSSHSPDMATDNFSLDTKKAEDCAPEAVEIPDKGRDPELI